MNAEVDSARLLAEFARSGSEPAFGELVRRHIDLVYSAARRRCAGDAALAEDVTQTVFADLARKAASLPRDVVPAGWLYRHACFVAATAVRTEVRRRNREETAAAMNQLHSGDASWSSVAPVLEDAMLELPDPDRDALVLRFFEGQPFARVGAALGVSEDAARMRVERALDRLREPLSRRGVTSAGAALAATLSTHAVTPAPTGLAATVIGSTALTPAAATATGWSVKSAWAWGAAAIATVAIVASLQLRGQIARQRAAAEAERATAQELLRQANAQRLDAATGSSEELTRLRAEHLELLRLRGEVTRLRQALAEAATKVTPDPVKADEPSAPDAERPTQVQVETRVVELSEAAARSLGVRLGAATTQPLTEAGVAALLKNLEQLQGARLIATPKITTLNERWAQLRIAPEPVNGDAQETDQGASVVDVTPIFDPRTRQFILSLGAGLVPASNPNRPDDADSQADALRGRSGTRRGPEPRVTVVVADGQTAVWTQPADSAGFGSRSGNDQDARHLMVLITPTAIDPAGNRLFSADTTPEPAPATPVGPSPGQ